MPIRMTITSSYVFSTPSGLEKSAHRAQKLFIALRKKKGPEIFEFCLTITGCAIVISGIIIAFFHLIQGAQKNELSLMLVWSGLNLIVLSWFFPLFRHRNDSRKDTPMER
jgi:hypothetical protein